jgi:hypothetical protein
LAGGDDLVAVGNQGVFLVVGASALIWRYIQRAIAPEPVAQLTAGLASNLRALAGIAS